MTHACEAVSGVPFRARSSRWVKRTAAVAVEWRSAGRQGCDAGQTGVASECAYVATQMTPTPEAVRRLQERLWVESGSSTPYLRDVLSALQSLSGATLRVSLGELAGGKNVRLQLVEEAPDQLAPPPLP